MVKKRTLSPLPIFDQTALPEFLSQHGFKEMHALTIWRYMAQNPTHTFDQIPHLSNKLKALLKEHFAHFTTTLTAEQRSSDGTVKLLLKLQDGHEIEAVIMKHTGRNTLCVSSQVGCQMACTFCATGTMGIIADLMSGEILEQLAYANTVAPIRNVVFMGMGEPLNNYDAVLAAIKAMTSVFSLAPKHITLSTVGVIHRIRQLTKVRPLCIACGLVLSSPLTLWLQDAPLVRLALSLHAPTQELRSEIVPTSKAYPLDKLMQAIDEHLAYKYVLLLLRIALLKKTIGNSRLLCLCRVQGRSSGHGRVLHAGRRERLHRDGAHSGQAVAGPIGACEPDPIQHNRGGRPVPLAVARSDP